MENVPVYENRKKEDILKAARRLFWKHGYKRVTVEEICENAAVSKMTFYKFFRNKLELARTVFDRVVSKGKEEFRAIMNSDLSPAEKMNRMFLQKLQGTNDISSEFLNDFYSNPELGLKEYIEKTTEAVWKDVISDFKTAQENGIIRKDFKPELIWYISQKMMDMINDENLLNLYNNPQDMIMDLAGFFLYGLLPNNEIKK